MFDHTSPVNKPYSRVLHSQLLLSNISYSTEHENKRRYLWDKWCCKQRKQSPMKSSWNSEKIIAFILGLQFLPILLAILYIVFPFWRFIFSSESQVCSRCFLLFLLLYISHFETFLRIINMRVEDFQTSEGLNRPVALQGAPPGLCQYLLSRWSLNSSALGLVLTPCPEVILLFALSCFPLLWWPGVSQHPGTRCSEIFSCGACWGSHVQLWGVHISFTVGLLPLKWGTESWLWCCPRSLQCSHMCFPEVTPLGWLHSCLLCLFLGYTQWC